MPVRTHVHIMDPATMVALEGAGSPPMLLIESRDARIAISIADRPSDVGLFVGPRELADQLDAVAAALRAMAPIEDPGDHLARYAIEGGNFARADGTTFIPTGSYRPGDPDAR